VFFAILLNKAIAVPIDERMDAEMQKEVYDLVTPALVISCNRDLKSPVKTIVFEELPPTKTTFKPMHIDPTTPAEILFTSGTWGKPKGVVLTHGNLLANVDSVAQVYHPKVGEKLLSILPLSHAYEQMCGLLVPLVSGSHIIYQQELDSYSLLRSLTQFQAHYMIVVPKFLEVIQNRILQSTKKYQTLFTSLSKVSRVVPYGARSLLFKFVHAKFGGNLKAFVVGGAPLSKELEQFFQSLGFRILIGYGLSESSPVLTISLEEHRPINSVGYPIPNTVLTIAEDGEVIAQGKNISPGYWPLSKKKSDILHTGDLGYIDQKGRLILTGRKKNLVVFPTGDKIQMEDIEHFANTIKEVNEACVVLKSMENDTQSLGLVYIGDIDETVLLKKMNEKLPLYAKLHFVQKWHEEQLPRSHTLKIRRERVHNHFSDESLV
jgi:long-chain acyl-CoA synthetase